MKLKPNSIYWTEYPYVEGAQLHEGLPQDFSSYRHVLMRTDANGVIFRYQRIGEEFRLPAGFRS